MSPDVALYTAQAFCSFRLRALYSLQGAAATASAQGIPASVSKGVPRSNNTEYPRQSRKLWYKPPFNSYARRAEYSEMVHCCAQNHASGFFTT